MQWRVSSSLDAQFSRKLRAAFWRPSNWPVPNSRVLNGHCARESKNGKALASFIVTMCSGSGQIVGGKEIRRRLVSLSKCGNAAIIDPMVPEGRQHK